MQSVSVICMFSIKYYYLCHIQGPCDRYQTATVFMNDNFHPHVTWRNPANRHQLEPNLTHIIRDQSFYVWLVAWNMVTMKSFVLQTISWRMQVRKLATAIVTAAMKAVTKACCAFGLLLFIHGKVAVVVHLAKRCRCGKW